MTSKNVATIPLRLSHYWVEEIPRDEALRRLTNRNLDKQRHAKIAMNIPERTAHILKFRRRLFQEFVEPGDGVLRMLLMLPMKRSHEKLQVICPMLESERLVPGVMSHPARVEFHEFKVVGGQLREKNEPRENFRYVEGPTNFSLSLQPLFDMEYEAPGAQELAVGLRLPIVLTSDGNGGEGGGGGNGGEGGNGGDGGNGGNGGDGGNGGGGGNGGSGGSETGWQCCGACEWVHSTLHIHGIDWLCCLHSCG